MPATVDGDTTVAATELVIGRVFDAPSRSLTETSWNATVIQGDVADLKAGNGRPPTSRCCVSIVCDPASWCTS
jgi:hypothetical protein